MQVEKTILDDVGVLALKGDFDSFVTNKFTDEIDSLIALGITKVVLNVRFLRFINSTALGSLVKAKKDLQVKGGDLVIAKPSAFVKTVMDNLGLSDVIQVFPEEDAALVHFHAEKTAEAVDIDGDNVLLFRFIDPEKARAISGKSYGVARITSIVEDGLSFVWDGGGKGPGPKEIPVTLFTEGTEIQVKFRLPYYRRAYYFEVHCDTGKGSVTEQGDVAVICRFKHIKEEDRKSIGSFVSDIRFLKKEIESVIPRKED